MPADRHLATTSPSFFFIDTPTTEIYTLSLHDALPISTVKAVGSDVDAEAAVSVDDGPPQPQLVKLIAGQPVAVRFTLRSEEHTSELQSRQYLVCRLLLEKKKTRQPRNV